MFALGSDHRYFLSFGAIDMRNGIEGLSNIIRNRLQCNPLSGDVFIFISRNRRIVKLLHWERGGFVLYQKRLEEGTFEMPKYNGDQTCYHMNWSSLVMLIEGITMKKVVRRKRYEL